jgi:hypothetical protein
MSDKIPPIDETDFDTEPMSNHSGNPEFSTILEKRLSRRQVLTGSLGAAVTGSARLALRRWPTPVLVSCPLRPREDRPSA